MYFVLSAFTSSPVSLVATTKDYAFSFTVSRQPVPVKMMIVQSNLKMWYLLNIWVAF